MGLIADCIQKEDRNNELKYRIKKTNWSQRKKNGKNRSVGEHTLQWLICLSVSVTETAEYWISSWFYTEETKIESLIFKTSLSNLLVICPSFDNELA